MDINLYKKIVDELAEINYSGRFTPHFYGEPLLDNRIIDLIKYTRQKLPKAHIVIFTNGDVLDYLLYRTLVAAGVDYFQISQHSKEMGENIKDLFNNIDNATKRKRIKYVNMYKKKDLINRGGLINLPKQNPIKMFIKKIYRWYKPVCFVDAITIDYEGNCVLCCNDYLSSVKFGNVKTENIVDIWNKENYISIRNQLKLENKKVLNICKKCEN
jgi:radical SAM protein with 4Fe4S-binding SPASM domain